MAVGGTPEQALEQVLDEVLDAVHLALQADARSWAAQVRATARLVDAARAGGSADRGFVELEVAGSWSLGQTTATRWMVEAEQLTTCLPATLCLLEAGGLLVHQARVLLHVTRSCTPAIARQVETEVLATEGLAGWCPADLRALATRVLLRIEAETDEAAAEQRHADAAAGRRTWAKPEQDGMGVAGALLTAEQLRTWQSGLDALEAQERVNDRDARVERSADQRRADLFAALPALVLAARAADPADPAGLSGLGVRPPVVFTVHVPMATVLGLSPEPGWLDGYGPISAVHVRTLRPVAFRRVLVDAESGRPVQVDERLVPLPDDDLDTLRTRLREAYQPTEVVDRAEVQHDPSAGLARLVDVRDRRCSGPGCGSTRTPPRPRRAVAGRADRGVAATAVRALSPRQARRVARRPARRRPRDPARRRPRVLPAGGHENCPLTVMELPDTTALPGRLRRFGFLPECACGADAPALSRRNTVKSAGEIMEVLEAFDLTGSFRDAAELAGCSHHTVARYVAAREAGGQLDKAAARPQLIDVFLPKVAEWVLHSRGKIRADKAHEKLLALGYQGSERTTRRAVSEAKVAFNLGQVRVHRPWVTEPGMWLQYDFGDGPVIDGRKTVLFCAWLAWSRFRVVLALRDRTAPTVFAALDVTLRRLGGAPTYVLTDNEKTVTTGHIAGMAVRNAQVVSFARHYGVTVHTCEPADPASKGGSESTVKLAKADLVPTDTNLLEQYDTFAELERACEQFCEQVNARVHRVTRRAPVEMLRVEQTRLHPLPTVPHTVAFGLARTVPARTPMIALDGGQYSVPHQLLGQQVWVRVHGQGSDEQVIVVHVSPAGPVEVARHGRATPGSPKLDDSHFPPQPAGALDRQPKARTAAEAEFLALGAGARMWLTEAAAAGSTKMRIKMAAAVALAKLGDPVKVDWALGHAAVNSRFAEADLASMVNHHARVNAGPRHQASETRSLTQGTGAWSALLSRQQQPAPAVHAVNTDIEVTG